ncbi:MAG TPA: ribosome-binding factor A [Polyangiaceae bacterium]|nr:ribosome-binding factor A [Polyangiaceae bacterium]
MSAEHGTRARRVGEAVRQELARMLSEEVKDPGAAGAVVTRVDMAADLRSARVHVRALGAAPAGPASGATAAPAEVDDPGRRRAVVDGLARASGLLRREVTRRLGLRYAPELRFVYDEGPEQSTRVEQLLLEIEAERRR